MRIVNKSASINDRYNKILDNTKDYYLIEVLNLDDLKNHVNSFSLSLINSLRYTPLHLIISNEFESFTDLFCEIYNKIILELEVPENKIILISGAKNIKELCQDYIESINTSLKQKFTGIRCEFFCAGEIDVTTFIRSKKNNLLKRELALQGKINYQKHFLCLNRRWRLHRPSLIALLCSKNLLSKGFVSLGTNEHNLNWNTVISKIFEQHINHQESSSLLLQNHEKILSLPNLVVDTDIYKHKKIELTYNSLPFYENSFMSIVTETNFYNYNTPFLSEKVFKPIAFLQPFILVSIPNSLQFLKELGYKTFHPYIDETYDNIIDDNERLMFIVKEIERICLMSNDDLKFLSQNLRDICKHNYKLLMSKHINNS